MSFHAANHDVSANFGSSLIYSSRAITKAEQGWFPYRHTPLGYVHQKDKDAYGKPIKGTAKIVRDPNPKNVEQVNREFELRDHYTHEIERLTVTISDESHFLVQRVFEFSINALSIWKSATREERVERLKRVCSNPILDGLTVRYELKKPFAMLAEMRSDSKWRRERDLNPRDAINVYTISNRGMRSFLR